MPAVVYDPPISMPGQPTIEGTRMSAALTAELVFWSGVADVMKDYVLTRPQVLVACWWAGMYGPKKFKQALGTWALEAHSHLWHSCVNVPDPPLVEQETP